MNPLGVVVVALMALSIVLIPLGLPGLWILAGLVVLGALLGEVSAWIAVACVLLAVAAELAEWLVVRSMNVRYGGSSRAFWGAIIGGMAGVLLGTPIPVVGSIIAGFLGSFLGAALVTYYEARDLDAARRVGWGVLLARTLSVGLKVAVAVVVLVLGGAAWVVR
jgi:uncharacterized protein YqgC (DUF456 family)